MDEDNLNKQLLSVFSCALYMVWLLKRKHTTIHVITLITYGGPFSPIKLFLQSLWIASGSGVPIWKIFMKKPN